MAILRAVSTASEPELAKKTESMSGGAICMMRDASSKAAGCPIWKVGAKSIVSTCRCTASTMGLRQWPAFTHQSPAEASNTRLPSRAM